MLQLDADRPDSNVLAGARYLRQLLDRFHSPDLALAAYNAGPTAVAEAGGAPTQATWEYVTRVTALWRDLRDCR
jgi:soluble lytic murein transglycosylase-like protein